MLVTYHKCPVCNRSWESQAKAIACRNTHLPTKENWQYCDICGKGWSVDAWGSKWTTKMAAMCEQEHRDKGEVEEIKRRQELAMRRLAKTMDRKGRL